MSPRVAVVTTGHDVADARLHRTVAALRRAGADVEVHGLGDAALGPRGARTTTRPRGGKLGRLLQALLLPWQVDADVLVTIDPDTSVAALLSSKVRRRRWVADVHEDYVAVLADRAWVPTPLRAVLQALTGLLGTVIRAADLVLVADEHLAPRRARKRLVMRNEPDFTLLPEVGPASDAAPWRAVHVGDNRTSRGLRTMVEAVAATHADAEPWHLDIVGPVAEADREWFEARLAEPDAALVTWHGRQEPRRSWEIAEGADVGLCLLADTPAFAAAMPSKVYEYLGCGLPTVATPLPRVAELLTRTRAGVIVDSVDETVEALRRFATDPAWRSVLQEAAREAAEVARARRSTYDEAAALVVALAR